MIRCTPGGQAVIQGGVMHNRSKLLAVRVVSLRACTRTITATQGISCSTVSLRVLH